MKISSADLPRHNGHSEAEPNIFRRTFRYDSARELDGKTARNSGRVGPMVRLLFSLRAARFLIGPEWR
jgi:hypothetical protein